MIENIDEFYDTINLHFGGQSEYQTALEDRKLL